jgi:pyruvate/2-oxoglutarate/acetoin dehydrogenase E1 component
MVLSKDKLKKIKIGNPESTYKDELTHAMTSLSKDKRVIFVGQQIVYPGNPMSETLKNVSEKQMIEMPVAEEFQLGFCNGLALNGYIPLSFYPRWDFLILAANQLCTHLDKLKQYSNGDFNPVVGIRVAVPTTEPIDPGVQHKSDYTEAFIKMLTYVNIVELKESHQIVPEYKKLLEENSKPTIFVEYVDRYGYGT